MFEKEIKKVLEDAEKNVESSPWCFLIADKLAQRNKKFSEFFTKGFVWIGIGGSSSGPRGIFRFFNINAEFLESPEDKISDYRRKFYVVSKSGTTYETLFLFKNILRKMRKKDIPENVLTLSQESDSPLLRLTKKYGIKNIPFPPELSGRFSTFFISYFPLAKIAPNISKGISRGLEKVRKNLYDTKTLHFRISEFLLQNKDKQDIFLCFYSRKMFEFSENLSQLIAESLGKDGKGFTPVPVLGPHFQHSVAQLVIANPKLKFAVFFTPKLRSPLIKEAEATFQVFSEKIPVMKIDYKENAEEIATILFSFQISIAICGKIMGINPFDQPEVKRIRDILEKGITKGQQ